MANATIDEITSTRGAREDLSNQLRRVEPQETPMFSLFPQGPAPKATQTEWLVDDLTEVQFGGKFEDGADLSFAGDYVDKFSARERLGNYFEEFVRPYAVSRVAELIDVAGPGSSLLAQAKSRSALEIKRDIEAAIGSSQTGAAQASTVGSKLTGLGQWTTPGATTYPFTSSGQQGYASVTNSRVDTTSTPLTETNMTTILQAIYEASGAKSGYRFFTGPSNMNEISQFVQTTAHTDSRRYPIGDGSTVRLSVTSYVSDYGEVAIIPDLFLGRADGAAIDAGTRRRGYFCPTDDTVTLRVLQGIKALDFPDVGGGGERGMMAAMLTIAVSNPRALGSVI